MVSSHVPDFCLRLKIVWVKRSMQKSTRIIQLGILERRDFF
jgi:hypothetical protein